MLQENCITQLGLLRAFFSKLFLFICSSISVILSTILIPFSIYGFLPAASLVFLVPAHCISNFVMVRNTDFLSYLFHYINYEEYRMKILVVDVDNCDGCPLCKWNNVDWLFECHHNSLDKPIIRYGAGRDKLTDMPEWCPLENKND